MLYSIVPHAVFGQSYQTFNWEKERIERETLWKIGPFRIYPRIHFRNIGYDNNVYRQRDDDDPISDFTISISPTASTSILFKNWVIMDFRVNPEYVYFAKTDRERSLNFDYSTGVKINLFHRFVLSGEYRYDRSRRRASSEFDVRVNQVLHRLEGKFFYETARETSLGLTASFGTFDFKDEVTPGDDVYVARQLNRNELTLSGEFYYRLRPETHFFVTGGYTDYRFEFEESEWRDSYSYQGSAGVRFPILGDIIGSVSLGYKKLVPKISNKKQFSGPIGNTNVTARIRRFILRALFRKDVRISYWTNNAFFMEDIYGLGVSFYITRFIRLDYDFSYGDNHYPEKTLVRLPDESYEEFRRKDKIMSHRLGTVFRIFGNTGVGLSLNLWERKSNDYRWGTRSSLFVGGYVTYDF